jgi:glycosyltransferase involved in cell wall biosynthesis
MRGKDSPGEGILKSNQMSNDIPLVTVMMPMFNGQNTVISAIESIQKQTLTTWQLLILDDGSSDDSYILCKEKANKDHRISVFRNKQNLGLAKCMNRLVSLAEGTYLAVQEQDDRSVPDRLEKEVHILETKPDVGIVSGIAAWVDQHDQLLAYFPGILARGEQYPQGLQEMVRYLYVEQCKVVNAACMIRRSVLDQIPRSLRSKRTHVHRLAVFPARCPLHQILGHPRSPGLHATRSRSSSSIQ